MAKYQFQTEVSQLLKLIIHSLYSNKDIFLREIVSNSSDALDKLKYLTLSDDAYKSVVFDPRIDISFDENAKTLTVKDTGIGMDEADLTANLGTIARSGTKAFLEKLEKEAKKDSALIGQFGVGFYSAFMTSTKIEVITRKAGTASVFKWTSDGTESYEIEELKTDSDEAKKYGFDTSHGAAVVMYLSDEDKGYATRWKIEDLVKRYSDHIAFPIFLHYEQKNLTTREKKPAKKTKLIRSTVQAHYGNAQKATLKKKTTTTFIKHFRTTRRILSCTCTPMQRAHRNTQHSFMFLKLHPLTCIRQITKAA